MVLIASPDSGGATAGQCLHWSKMANLVCPLQLRLAGAKLSHTGTPEWVPVVASLVGGGP